MQKGSGHKGIGRAIGVGSVESGPGCDDPVFRAYCKACGINSRGTSARGAAISGPLEQALGSPGAPLAVAITSTAPTEDPDARTNWLWDLDQECKPCH